MGIEVSDGSVTLIAISVAKKFKSSGSGDTDMKAERYRPQSWNFDLHFHTIFVLLLYRSPTSSRDNCVDSVEVIKSILLAEYNKRKRRSVSVAPVVFVTNKVSNRELYHLLVLVIECYCNYLIAAAVAYYYCKLFEMFVVGCYVAHAMVSFERELHGNEN
uniref:Uncharacterized protein n=1 Tax=Glossina pallidipes TaxID=7398 RepID=A0A1B0A9P6_GLOPL